MNNYPSTQPLTQAARKERGRDGGGRGQRRTVGVLLLEVADNGQRWGRARRAKRAEPLPAACCLLVGLMVGLEVKRNRTLCCIACY